jgi:hypothetical protein
MKTLISIIALALSASAALSQAPSAAPEAKSDGGFNPNEMVCRRINQSGSRLNAARLCMTRQEWIDYQRQQRADTEQSQNRRVAPR